MIPLVKHATIWSAIAATATADLQSGVTDMGQAFLARSIYLEINGGSTPNWALAIQGKVSASATWHNIDFFRMDQGTAQVPTATTLTVNWTSAQYYVIPNPPPFVRLVGTRTGGTITVYASYSTEAFSFALATAGSAVVGAVSVDQTTPGTTNRVQAGVTLLPASTVVMSVAGAYATGDYMGTSTAPQSFTPVNGASGQGVVLESVTISDKIVTANVAMELWLFSATFVAPTDNGAWAISDAEALTVQAIIPIDTGSWYASSNNQVWTKGGRAVVMKPAAQAIFYALVARGTTLAFTSADLTIQIGVLAD